MAKLLILYGTLTMNTELVAQEIYNELQGDEHFTEVDIENVYDINDFSTLQNYDAFIIGSSTWGEGDYNPDTEEFMENIKESELDLKGKKASFFGLGESHYEEYCEAIKNISNYFTKELGVDQVGFIHEIDGFPEDEIIEGVKDWALTVIEKMK